MIVMGGIFILRVAIVPVSNSQSHPLYHSHKVRRSNSHEKTRRFHHVWIVYILWIDLHDSVWHQLVQSATGRKQRGGHS